MSFKRKHNHDAVKQLHAKGLSHAKIAQTLNMPKTSVTFILNYKPNPNGKKLPAEVTKRRSAFLSIETPNNAILPKGA